MKSAWLFRFRRSFLQAAVSALLSALLSAMPAFANAATTVLVDGAAYPADLRENTELLSHVRGARPSQARHYEGELTGVGDSWVRVSNIRGHWQGVVSLQGRRFVVDESRQRNKAGDIVLDAQSPTEIMSGMSCAAEAPTSANATLAEELSSGVTANADFAAVCQTKVDGVCLLAELDIAFDLLFQQRFPSTYQDQAASILNIVDGYYRNDLAIQFDVLSMTFLSNDLFSTTTDSDDLLDDIANKKDLGQVPFVTNPRAILHVVTGRDFDTTTIGIAIVGSLCSTTHNVGTAQIVNNSIPLTGLVIAHEIGHNFGAVHDGTGMNTCTTSGFIMAATLNGNVTHFSSCSIDEITTEINSQPNLGACFEFPVDAVLAARAGNPTTAAASENFTLDYDVTETHASVASAELRASGTFAAAGGTFVAATINGTPCTVASNAQSYLCVTGNSGGLLEVTARVTGGVAMTIGATVAVGPGGGAKDIDASNNSADQTVTTSTAPAPPAPPAPPVGGGGGGGGGSFGAELAPLLMGLFALRRRRTGAA